MELKELVAPTIKELFVKELETLILSGKLKPGDRLPTEREMAASMKVSRTIINAGVNELAFKGFVEIRPRHGTIVSDYLRRGQLETLVSIMNFNHGRFDRKTFDSLMDFRLNTEVLCAREAATNRDPKDLELLEDCLRRIQAGGDLDQISELMFEFHHTLFCATGNVIYPLVYNAFRNVSMAFTKAIFEHAGLADAGILLPELLAAVRNQDAAAAAAIMTDLIRRRIRQLEAGYFS